MYNTQFGYGHNSPLEYARELFKLSKHSCRLFSFRSRVFCWCLHNERMFMHICLHLDDDVIPLESSNPSDFVTRSFFGFQATIRVFRAVVLKLFLIVYHLCVSYCHHVPPCSRKSQCAKYHSIKSLENQNWHKCNVNKMAVRNFNGRF